SEGWDRTSLALPGRQDELVRRVAAVNDNTVVVVNAGAPVLLPWLSQVRTVLWSWFPGQECGHALADVLFGSTEPSGRLPWTLPATFADVPIPHAIPVDGVVDYRESIHIGYRGYAKNDTVPAAAFGHGMGWTDWEYLSAETTETAHGIELDVTVRNTGRRHGHEVVQVYASTPDSGIDRPARWLAGFTVAQAAAGDRTTVTVRLPRRAFEIWDVTAHDWRRPPGTYTLHIGRSVVDIHISTDVIFLSHAR
ncbi:MAG: glycoside hydrolase family 3 C-terminal domain-containing protein, partial [Stackebrandtia sp.]